MQYVEQAYTDAYRRFIRPAIRRDCVKELAQRGRLPGELLRRSLLVIIFTALLMQAPLKDKDCFGLDPAFRTGCKLAVVDPTGKFLAKTVIYPHEKLKASVQILKNELKQSKLLL